jgi:hypothetical protein
MCLPQGVGLLAGLFDPYLSISLVLPFPLSAIFRITTLAVGLLLGGPAIPLILVLPFAELPVSVPFLIPPLAVAAILLRLRGVSTIPLVPAPLFRQVVAEPLAAGPDLLLRMLSRLIPRRMERLAARFGAGAAIVAMFEVWGIAQTLVMLSAEFLLYVGELVLQVVTDLR